MPRQKRTTKTLAQRVDVNYFQRPHPFRRWKLILSIAAPAAALLWLGALAIAQRQKVYSPGPLSQAHAVFGARCELCHQADAGFFSRQVSDQKCATCHDGPMHQARQTFTPQCSSCHVEHLGAARLVQVADAGCVRCHSALNTTAGPAKFEKAVGNFRESHPEFRAAASDFRDPGTIKLNHQVHLKRDLKGPGGRLVQMECSDCHRPLNQGGPWPYAIPVKVAQPAAAGEAAADTVLITAKPSGAYMAPMTYEQQCAGCHALDFDKRFPPAAHEKPEVIRKFLVDSYSAFIAANPQEIRNLSVRDRRRVQQEPPRIPRTREEWVALEGESAERLLWQERCKFCHAVQQQGTELPQIAKPAIAARWFQHADFNHESHRLLKCAACHQRTASSKETSQSLVPGIQTCRQCHRADSSTAADAVDARCSVCHSYHDRSKEKPVKGPYTLPQLLGSRARPGPEGGQ